MSKPCDVRRLATVTYENGLAMQDRLVGMRQRGEISDQILLLQHTPVITTTRHARPENLHLTRDQLKQRGVGLFETNRGGDVTYHAPGQLVGYPLLHLGEGSRDIRRFVTNLEEALIQTVSAYGISAARRSDARGVWVGNDKIAAIGVRIARWVTSHGFALNVTTDLSGFSMITPCGLKGSGVTSIQRETGSAVSIEEVEDLFLGHFSEIFGLELVPREHEIRVVKVVLHDDSRFLLLKRLATAGGFWQPVTGVIEEGESPQEAAIREVHEETGLVASPSPLDFEQSFLIEPEFLDGATLPLFAYETCFEASISQGVEIQLDQEEHEDHRWFSLEEAANALEWSDDVEALMKVAANTGTHVSG